MEQDVVYSDKITLEITYTSKTQNMQDFHNGTNMMQSMFEAHINANSVIEAHKTQSKPKHQTKDTRTSTPLE